MSTISNALGKKLSGLNYGNRILLPFNCNFLKVIIDDEIITDFSPSSKGILVIENEGFTEIYFPELKNIKETVSKFESIKMVICEKNDNLFDIANHKKIALYLEEKHNVKIEKTDEDILFIE